MGLLNGGGWDDPLTQGLLALSAGLLTPRYKGGGFGMGIGNFANATMAASKLQQDKQQQEMQRKLWQSQLDENVAQAAQRKAAMDRQAAMDRDFAGVIQQPYMGADQGPPIPPELARPVFDRPKYEQLMAKWLPKEYIDYLEKQKERAPKYSTVGGATDTYAFNPENPREPLIPLGVGIKPPTSQVNVTADMRPAKVIEPLVENSGKDIQANKTKITRQWTQLAPVVSRIENAIEQGMVQGSIQDIRRNTLEFFRLFGATPDEVNKALDNSQSGAQALASIAINTVKQLGANPSNADMVLNRIRSGDLSNSPDALYSIMQAMKADMYNMVAEHNESASGFLADNPDVAPRVRSSMVIDPSRLPNLPIDAQMYAPNEMRYFMPTGKGPNRTFPKQGIFGPLDPATKRRQLEAERAELQRQLDAMKGR